MHEIKKPQDRVMTTSTLSHFILDPGQAGPKTRSGLPTRYREPDSETISRLERVRVFSGINRLLRYRRAWLRQEGEIRLSPDGPWLPFKAEQTLNGSGIDFTWTAKTRISKLFPVTVVDSFEAGRGLFSVR